MIFYSAGTENAHSFRFEDSYDSLCYKFYLKDIEEQNLRLKTERVEPPVENYTKDTKPLIEARCPINCPHHESTDINRTLSPPILNIENHSETEESFECFFDKDEKTDKIDAAEKDSSDSRTDVSITHNTSHTETLSKPVE